MEKYYGWAGTILYVDLTEEKVAKVPLPRDLTKRFLGGRGINMKLLFDEVGAETDAMSPNNALIFGTGPLTGTLVGSRGQVSAISPITGFIGDASAAGHFPAELKIAGYDHVVIRGKAKKPVYLWINDDEVEIRDAKDLWGLNVWEMTNKIRELENDSEIQVAGIGQAGENLVRLALIMNSFSRAFGRTGLGCVMGSKNLKALAVRGSRGVKIAKPEEFLAIFTNIYHYMTQNPLFKEGYPKYGTSIIIDPRTGYETPCKNFNDITMEGIENVSPDVFLKHTIKHRACLGCFYHCDHFYKLQDIQGPGLEYESISAFGPRVGCTDWPTILLANNLANQYGIDVVSTGGAIGLAMDLYERGILTKGVTDGLEMSWGNKKAIIQSIHRISKREGEFGNLMAEGPYLMAQKIGSEAPGRVLHAKGLDPSAVESRGDKLQALAYLTSTIGATHLRLLNIYEPGKGPEIIGREFPNMGSKVVDERTYDIENKPQVAHFRTKGKIILDSLGLCLFAFRAAHLPGELQEDWVSLLNAVTGMKWNLENVDEVATRVNLLEIANNARRGYSSKDDFPCERSQTEPIASGDFKGEVIKLEPFKEMLNAYYKLLGCQVGTGIPTSEKLFEVDLPEVAEELERLEKISTTGKVSKGEYGQC